MAINESSAPATFDPVAYINEPRWQTSRLGLDRIRELLQRLGNPQNKLRFVHVAGTNGKGSVCAYLASILQAAHLRVGLFTSPYIEQFEERIRINGQQITPADLLETTLEVRKQAEAMASQDQTNHPTEFELMTAVALLHFAKKNCDIVVLEVGLGGRLDSTNVIAAPDVAVIARIGLDHTAILGNTLAQVAAEKAGIIKAGSRVVSWPQEAEAMQAVSKAATAAGCPLSVASFAQLKVGKVQQTPDLSYVRSFTYGAFGTLKTRLLGTYQPQNAALALEVVAALRECGWDIPKEAVRKGVASAVWPGRFEVLPRSSADAPTVVIDGGHNPQGAQVLAQSLQDVFPATAPVFVMGVMADKDYRAMLQQILPLACAVVTTTPNNPRALPAGDLAEAARAINQESGLAAIPVTASSSFSDAIAQAQAYAAQQEDPQKRVICAFGSLYVIADIKKALRAAGLL